MNSNLNQCEDKHEMYTDLWTAKKCSQINTYLCWNNNHTNVISVEKRISQHDYCYAEDQRKDKHEMYTDLRTEKKCSQINTDLCCNNNHTNVISVEKRISQHDYCYAEDQRKDKHEMYTDLWTAKKCSQINTDLCWNNHHTNAISVEKRISQHDRYYTEDQRKDKHKMYTDLWTSKKMLTNQYWPMLECSPHRYYIRREKNFPTRPLSHWRPKWRQTWDVHRFVNFKENAHKSILTNAGVFTTPILYP